MTIFKLAKISSDFLASECDLSHLTLLKTNIPNESQSSNNLINTMVHSLLDKLGTVIAKDIPESAIQALKATPEKLANLSRAAILTKVTDFVKKQQVVIKLG